MICKHKTSGMYFDCIRYYGTPDSRTADWITDHDCNMTMPTELASVTGYYVDMLWDIEFYDDWCFKSVFKLVRDSDDRSINGVSAFTVRNISDGSAATAVIYRKDSPYWTLESGWREDDNLVYEAVLKSRGGEYMITMRYRIYPPYKEYFRPEMMIRHGDVFIMRDSSPYPERSTVPCFVNRYLVRGTDAQLMYCPEPGEISCSFTGDKPGYSTIYHDFNINGVRESIDRLAGRCICYKLSDTRFQLSYGTGGGEIGVTSFPENNRLVIWDPDDKRHPLKIKDIIYKR